MTTVTLTPEQQASLTLALRRAVPEVTVTLTREQSKQIKRSFPELEGMKMTVRLPINEVTGAPFIPGGAVLSAAISGVSQLKGAIGDLSQSSGD
jgi:hypothetical protein